MHKLSQGWKSEDEKKTRGRIFLASLSASEPRDPVCGLLGRVSGSRGVTESLFLLSSTEPLFLLSSTQPFSLLSLQVLSTVPLSLTEPLFLCHGTKVTEPLITHSHILTHICSVLCAILTFSPTCAVCHSHPQLARDAHHVKRRPLLKQGHWFGNPSVVSELGPYTLYTTILNVLEIWGQIAKWSNRLSSYLNNILLRCYSLWRGLNVRELPLY